MKNLDELLLRMPANKILLLIRKKKRVTSTQLWKALGNRNLAYPELNVLMAKGMIERDVLKDKQRQVVWTLTKTGKRWCKCIDVLHRIEKNAPEVP